MTTTEAAPGALHELAAFARTPTVRRTFAGYWLGIWIVMLATSVPVLDFPPVPVALLASFDALVLAAMSMTAALAGWMLPVGRRLSAWHMLAVCALAVAVVVARAFAVAPFPPLIGFSRTPPLQVLINMGPRHLLLVATCVGLGRGVRSLLHARREAARLAALEADVQRARVHAMRTHLRPDVLLRSLDAIAELVPVDARAADRRLIQTSELLRASLVRSRAESTTLEDELAYLRMCAAHDAWGADAPPPPRDRVPAALRGARVPVGTVVRMVEAAGGGVLGAACGGGRLRLTVRQSGSPAAALEPPPLEALRAMLRAAGVEGASVSAAVRRSGGRVVRVELPAEVPAVLHGRAA